MKKVKFNPVLSTKKLLGSLDERPRLVLVNRFGLESGSPRTLESIGREHGITRERVRQIEAFALNKMRKSREFSSLGEVFLELKDSIESHGGLVEEDYFLNSSSKQSDHRPHLHFLLVAGSDFNKMKECKDFFHSWTTDVEKAEAIRDALKKLHMEMDYNTLLGEKDILNLLSGYLKERLKDKIEEEILLSLLNISKKVSSNALGEWGVASSPYINPRGMRDYAFLVMRKHGSPMHFSEVAGSIKENFEKPAHVQTVHNELIKDGRFVLVGRGLYALKEWGYKGGVVRNVIEEILSKHGALSREDIVKKVLTERYVKENTILVNLQNKDYFKRDTQGNYARL